MRHHANGLSVLVWAIFLALACSKVSVSKVASNNGRLENGTKTNEPRKDKDERTKDEDAERAIPPTVVSGTHLVCELTRDASATQATTLCALREDKTENKVDLDSFARSHQWQAATPELNGLTSSSRELPMDASWHWELVLKAGTPAQLDEAIDTTLVTLSLRGVNGRNESVVGTPLGNSGGRPHWMGLNGSRVPATAIAGGTEHIGRDILSLCRVYDRGGVYPGKLEPHHANPDKSVCYSTREGEAIMSQSDDGRTTTHKSDVLVPGPQVWSDVLEWTTIMPPMSLPKNAFVGGVDDKGEALLICRGLESGPPLDPDDRPNDPTGEWTPGYVKASAAYCQHEYYMQKNSFTFQVLIWKQP